MSIESSQLLDLLDSPIAFHRAFISVGAGVTGALMLSQAIYWMRSSMKRKPVGWFWKSMEQWEAETGLSRTEQETARRKLRAAGILLEKKEGIPCKIYYSIDLDTLQARLQESCKQGFRFPADCDAGFQQTDMQDSSRQDEANPANSDAGFPQAIPITTPGTTPGTTPNPKSCSGPKAATAPAPDPGTGLALVNGSKEVVPKALNGKIKAEAKTGAIWAAYSAAYFNRYGAEPVRNAKINGQLAQIIDRLGADEAPHVAACYVGSSNAFYVARRHSVDCLLRDCESLRTEWATGTRITATEARQMDQHEAGAEAARWVTENKEMLRQMRREGKI